MNRLDKKNIKASCAAFFALLGCLSCGADNDSPQGQCTDAQCYAVCQANAWTGMTESFWVFTAFCADKNTCNCFNTCDDDLCDTYCKEEKDASGGYCDFLSCSCIYLNEDAGDEDAGDKDAGDDTSK